MPCDDCSRAETCPPCVNEEPKGSASSSPDDECWCGHGRGGHSMGFCVGEVLVAGGTDRENCRCRAFVPAAGETAGEPEARCEGCGHTDAEGCGCPPSEAPPSRPPYAVAYVTGSGARIELALPGEASCAVIDGALVICHPSQVLGIAEVKPWEGQ